MWLSAPVGRVIDADSKNPLTSSSCAGEEGIDRTLANHYNEPQSRLYVSFALPTRRKAQQNAARAVFTVYIALQIRAHRDVHGDAKKHSKQMTPTQITARRLYTTLPRSPPLHSSRFLLLLRIPTRLYEMDPPARSSVTAYIPLLMK